MWCPSVSLSVWANAWLAGVAAPDDVLDALSQWAPRHSVTAYDSVAAGRTGLPWPDLTDAGAVSLLQTVRTAAGPRPSAPAIGVALPVPGDVRGLPAGTQFQRDAVTAGEAMIIGHDASTAVGLVPEFEYDELEDESEFEPGADVVVVDGVFTACGGARSNTSTSARRSTNCVRPFVRPPTRSAPSARQAPTSPTRAGSSSRCSKAAVGTGCPTTHRRGRCGCWRTPPTSTRSSPSAPG